MKSINCFRAEEAIERKHALIMRGHTVESKFRPFPNS